MTLFELSREYAASAELIARRLCTLRQMYRQSPDAVERQQLQRRISELRPLLRQCREVQKLTAHYYDRSFRRDAKYTL